MSKEKVIALVGPTATGKTKLGIEIAQKYNGEIINTDAYQIYKTLDIATVKPTKDEQKLAKHHLIDFKEIDERYSAFEFIYDARKKITEIIAEKKLPIIVGGSGFFLQVLLGDRVLSENNLPSEVPDKASIENRIYDTLIIGLNFDKRELLYEKINERVDLMFQNGLLNEVEKLNQKTKLEVQSAHAIGYSQFIEYFKGDIDLEQVRELIKRDSRHYAKRQITFFKNQFQDIKWFEPNKAENILKNIDQFIN